MTPQEMFDKVALHLLTQNKKAVSADNLCRYRHEGLSCAAGCLITDEAYSPLMEDAQVDRHQTGQYQARTDALERALLDSGVDRPLWPLLRRLQKVHDDGGVATWPDGLFRLAAKEKLDARVVTEFER